MRLSKLGAGRRRTGVSAGTAALLPLLLLAGCGAVSGEEAAPPVVDLAPEADPAPAEDAPEERDLFREMPADYMFCSGAGGWRTMLHIEPDGAFSGVFEDADTATIYQSTFSGRFTRPVRVDDTTWSMEIADMETERTPGEEEDAGELHYIYEMPYGLDGAEELLIYLPGSKTADLPEEFLSWTSWTACGGAAMGEELPFWGIYNVQEQEGFMEYGDITLNYGPQEAGEN